MYVVITALNDDRFRLVSQNESVEMRQEICVGCAADTVIEGIELGSHIRLKRGPTRKIRGSVEDDLALRQIVNSAVTVLDIGRRGCIGYPSAT